MSELSISNIDSIVKALGMMIEVPIMEADDPNIIGSPKRVVGVYREPILTGVNRVKIQDKLTELIMDTVSY